MALVVLWWEPRTSTQLASADVTDTVEFGRDLIFCYALDQDVDGQAYPDGRYYEFGADQKLKKIVVVLGSRVVGIDDLMQTSDGEIRHILRGLVPSWKPSDARFFLGRQSGEAA